MSCLFLLLCCNQHELLGRVQGSVVPPLPSSLHGTCPNQPQGEGVAEVTFELGIKLPPGDGEALDEGTVHCLSQGIWVELRVWGNSRRMQMIQQLQN